MPTLAQKILALVIRHALVAYGADRLVEQGAHADLVQFSTAAAAVIVGLIWSMWEKYATQEHIDVALNLPAFSDRDDILKRLDLNSRPRG
jgi:hypothetical protein